MSDVTDQLAQRFADAAANFAPQVADAAKQAATIEAYSCLASSLLFFGVAFAAAFAALKLYRKAQDDSDWYPGVFIFGVLAVLISIPGAWAWLDPWTWITINHPELWIAKRAFNL